MPDESGRIKGISVSRVWPGHRDYEPPEPPPSLLEMLEDAYLLPPIRDERSERAWKAHRKRRAASASAEQPAERSDDER